MAAKNTVFFLGAGASKCFGYPMTNEIMTGIMNNLYDHNLFRLDDRKTKKEKEYENELSHFIGLLYPGLKNFDPKKYAGKIPNITEVLSLIDHLSFYNIPPHPKLEDNKLQHFHFLLNRALFEFLLDYEMMPYTSKEKKLLQLFTGPIKDAKRNGKVSIITTNYDLIIDREFSGFANRNLVDYGIAYRRVTDSQIMLPPVNPILQYFKLHGSLNWLKCDLCGQYYINHDGAIIYQNFKEDIDDDNTCICNNSIRLKTVLVAPSIVRDIRDSNLLQIWKGALEAIRTADKLIIIGYSLPAEDLAIKSIIMRGLNGRSKQNDLEIEIVQFGDEARPNFVNLFGSSIKYYNKGLEDYLTA